MLAKHYSSTWYHQSSCKCLQKYIPLVFQAVRIKALNRSSKHLDLPATRNQGMQKLMSLVPYKILERPNRGTLKVTFPFLVAGKRHLQNWLYIINVSTTITLKQFTNRVQVSNRTLLVHLKLKISSQNMQWNFTYIWHKIYSPSPQSIWL